jgi:hypothetical protein
MFRLAFPTLGLTFPRLGFAIQPCRCASPTSGMAFSLSGLADRSLAWRFWFCATIVS